MNLIVLTALIAVCGAAKLDRTYLPPASAKTAGGSPGSLQTPFAGNSFTNGNNGLGGIPKGSYENDFQGVVVDAAAAGTRTSEDAASGLGAPRVSYGSTNSKVGAAAFKTGPAAFRQQTNDGQAASSAVQGSAQEFSGSSNQGSFSGSAQDAFPGSSNQGSFSASSNQGFSASERPRAALDRNAGILRFENEVGPENYHYAFETDNGISAEENGVATNGVQAQGGFSYTSDDGQVYSISYTADENGYRPTGDHLPTPPPIPEEILKSLEQNAREEAAGLVDDGSYNAEKYNAGSDYSERDDANGKFTHQSSNFGRPEADTAASGTFVNQNNQPFRKPAQSNFGSQSLSSGNQNGQSSGFSGQSHGTHATEHDQSNDEAEQSTMDFNGQFGQNSASKQGSSAFGKVMTGSQGQGNAFGSFSGAANQAGSGSRGFGAFNAQSNSQSGQSNGFNNNGPKGSSDQGASSGKFEQSGSQNSGNRFSSSTAASAQSGPSSQGFGNRNEYLPPVNRPNQSGRPQNGRIQSNKAQNGRPQTPITGSADTSIQSEKDTKGGSSPTTVPLGQQGLQSESRPQAAVTSFGQPIVASELSSQNGLGSDNQNKPSNGRRPSFTANAFAHGQSSQSNKPNEYLPPDNRRPQNRPQGSNAASQYNQQANGNAQATGNFQSPQGRPEIPSTSSPGSQSTFGSQTQQYNGFQRPQSQRPGQNGNRFPSSQTQTQFGSTSAQSNIGFNAQKATAEPERELTTPLETSSDDIAQAAAQTTAASFTSPAKPNERPSQSSFSGQFTNDNRFSSQPNTRPQASNPRPFSQTRVPTFPTQSSVGQFNQNSQFGNQEQFQSTFNTNDDVQYSSSTQRPSYAQQPQGPNDSYYYNQPSKPFGTPQGSRFPSAPSNQFDRVNQQSSFSQNGQLSSSQQDNVEPTGLPSVQFSGSTKYPMPPTLAPNSPQIQGLFSSQSQGSTKYPRPPTIAPTAPSSQFQSTVSGITQASASPFPSQSPTQASQGQFGSRPSYQQSSQFSQSSQSTNSFAKQPIRPSFGQQSTAISSAPQRPASSAFQSQSLHQDEPAIDNAEKPVPSQQYNGEIYEYNKPAQTLPPPDSTPASSTAGSFGQKFPAQGQQQFGGQSRPQFGQTNDEEDQRPSTQFGGQTSAQASRPQFGSQSRPQFGQTGQSQSSFTAPTQQMTDDKPYGALAQSQNDFAAQTSKRPSGSRPQFGAQPSRPQFGQAQSSLNAQSQSSQQPEEETPEFVSSQTQPEEQQSHSSQGSKNQFGFIPACCKDNAGRKPESQGFGDRFSQTSFAGAQNRPQPTSSFAGKGEEFGGPRSPPSFDEQTGYHY